MLSRKDNTSSLQTERAARSRTRLRLLGWAITVLTAWVAVFLLLRPISQFLVFNVLRLSAASALGRSAVFFAFEAPRMLMTLVVVIFVFGVIRSFFSPAKVRSVLAGKGEVWGSVMAAVLGVFTPFCSCSAIPLFIGFLESGVPLGVTFSFLIAAPMVNEIAVGMLLNMFGLKAAALYIGTGLLIAVVSGLVISRLKLERFIEDWVWEMESSGSGFSRTQLSLDERVLRGLQAVRGTLGRTWPFVIVGIAAGSVIHGYVPDAGLAAVMGKHAWWSVPAAVAIGVPIYSSAAGIMPVVQALMEKGAAVGTVFAFMMAVTGLSLPEMIIVRRVLKPQLIGVFVAVVTVSIIIVGLMFNLVL